MTLSNAKIIPTMASSSTSPIHKSFKYDVFLSFRGEDTRKTFVDHLYHALKQKDIHTYKDDEEIKKGEKINDELIRSIEDSKFYIIVFSKDYASSSWCLKELVKIMECQRMQEHTAYPLFYDVEPTEVRHQLGAVGKAFAKHQQNEDAWKWREALREAAGLAGWELKTTSDGHEAKFIQKIIEEMSLELRFINFSIDENLVGMETRIKDIVSSLEIDTDDVRMIGIKGMGGGGKTTLARAVFDLISPQFEGKSFIENVREVSKASLSGLKSLQYQVLQDVTNDRDISVSSVYDGKDMIKRRMRERKVLVVLDDVDHIEQLEALAGDPNWFKSGSRIIITTRDEQVVVAHRVKSIHNVQLLSDDEAICLFNRYAFVREIPVQRYAELSKQVVRYAAGLPLTIRVLGSFLCGKNELEWIDALERLKTIPLAETLKKLEISYISLEEDYKEIFLDVACIMKGWSKDLAIKALESCGFHARNGLRVLEQKSLITISYGYEYVGMHDSIEEMGKNIVRRSHPQKPNQHSRLWIDEEIEDILANDLGTKATRSIQFYTENLNPYIIIKGLKKMKQLRFLSVDMGDCFWNWESDKVCPNFPDALGYMRLSYYPFRSLPNTFKATNLVALEIADSKIIQLWEGTERKVLNRLRFLDLSCSMLSTLDLGLTPNLETLTLDRCSNLVEVHMPVGCLKLISIHLGCSRLKTLDLGLAPNLEKLILVDCDDLVELHMPSRCLNLKSVVVTNSKLRTLNIGLTPNLHHLDLKNCYCLKELHMVDECQKLSYLDISHSKLRTLNLWLTPNLKKLDLKECCNLVELHAPNGCLNQLVELDLSGCLSFRTFKFLKRAGTSPSHSEDQSLGPLAELNLIVECLKICPIHPDKDLPKFQFTCTYKEDIPSLTINLGKLISFGVCACTDLETFSGCIYGLSHLRRLELHGRVPEVSKDLDQLECLEELILSTTDVKHLPDSICMLKHLKVLRLQTCYLLKKLPENLGLLECLEKLTLSYTKVEHLPDSICMLKHLKTLEIELSGCPRKLLENLEKLECLEELVLSSSDIEYPPDSIFKLKNLKSLQFRFCACLKKLPEDLGQLEFLEELVLSSTKIKHLPDSICMLKHLKSLELKWCSLLGKLPKDIGRLECLEKLQLESEVLQDIPNSVCKMKCLKHLCLNNCIRVEKLPEELGGLECLKELFVAGTGISQLPQSIHLLKGLHIVGSRGLLQSSGFTADIEISDHGMFCYVQV